MPEDDDKTKSDLANAATEFLHQEIAAADAEESGTGTGVYNEATRDQSNAEERSWASVQAIGKSIIEQAKRLLILDGRVHLDNDLRAIDFAIKAIEHSIKQLKSEHASLEQERKK